MKRIVITTLALFLIATSWAQTHDELKNLIQQAYLYFPKIKELDKASSLDEVAIDLARSNYLPNVNGNASYTYLDPVGKASFPIGPDQTTSIKFQPNNNYNANVSLTQTVWDFGRTKAQVDKAKATMLAGKTNIEVAKAQLASQVASIYYSLIYLKQAIDVQDSVIAFYDANKRIVEGRIKQGDALTIDLSNIESNRDQEVIRKIDFQKQYARQLALLQYTTGVSTIPTGNSFMLSPTPSSENDFAVQHNPEVKASDLRIEAAEASRQLAYKNQLPNLSLQALAGVRNGYQPDIQEMRFNYSVGVGMSVPIFQGNRIRQNIMLADRSVEVSQLARDNVLNTLQKDLSMMTEDIKAYTEQIQHASSQIDLAEEALRLTQVRYREGVATHLELVNASANLQRAKLSKLQYTYMRTLAEVEQARLLGWNFWEN